MLEELLMVSAGFFLLLFVILFLILVSKPRHQPFENRKERRELASIKKQINGDEDAW